MATIDPLAAYRQTTGTTGKKSSDAGSEDRFLTLLVTQLKNQDPLNPLDNAQVTSQMAQINTVKGIEELNATLNVLAGRVESSESLAALSAVGRQALVPGDSISLYNGEATAGFELPANADSVTVKIYDNAGGLLHTGSLGRQQAGIHTFTWDGKTDAGASAVNNTYRFVVEAKAGKDSLDVTSLSRGRIDGVLPGADGPTFKLGNGLKPVPMTEVRQYL